MSHDEEDRASGYVPLAARDTGRQDTNFLILFAACLLGGLAFGAYPLLQAEMAGDQNPAKDLLIGVQARDAQMAEVVKAPSLQKDEMMTLPAPAQAPEDTLRAQDYKDILPKIVSIPAAEPDLTQTQTVAEATGSSKNQPASGYVLGDEGMTPEMEAAFRVVNRGKATGGARQDENVFREAAARIGYVPAGVDPNSIRTPGAPLGSVGDVETGFADVISGHLIALNGTMIRLQGVRAPGPEDICLNAEGGEYDCASWSKAGLTAISKDREMSCEITADKHPEGGTIGWCNIRLKDADQDLGVLAVSAGILVSDPNADGFSPYDIHQRDAKTSGYGVWSGKMEKRNP